MGTSLITATEYKAYAGISSTNQDTEIAAIIPRISELIKSICRRTFVDYVDEYKVEVSNGGTGSYIYMKEYPLLTLAGVEYSSDYGQTYTDLVEYTDYVLDLENSAVVSVGTNSTFPKAINGYRLTYTAGYEVLPEDLKLAALDLVTYYLKNDMAVHSPKAPGTNSVQIEYITKSSLPAHISRILDLYTGSFD